MTEKYKTIVVVVPADDYLALVEVIEEYSPDDSPVRFLATLEGISPDAIAAGFTEEN